MIKIIKRVTVLMGMKNGVAAMKNRMKILKDIKIELTFDPESHFWVCIKKNWNQDVKVILAPQCSLRQYSQQ